MSQHDYVIANGTGAAVRSDLNNALAAIVSQNSGATAPATTYAYQWWADTTTGLLKIRNAANNAWITLRELDGTLTIEDGTASSPGLAFADDLNTGIYSPSADQLGITTGGTVRLTTTTTGITSALPVDVPLGTASAPTVTFTGDLNTGIYSPSADQVAISTNGAGRLFVSSGGQIGVGTSTVGSSGNANITIAGANNSGIQFGRTNATAGGGLLTSASGPGIAFHYYTGAVGSETYTEAMRLDSSGRLGIGTTTVSDKLHVDAGNITLSYNGGSTGLRNKLSWRTESPFFDEQAYIAANRTASSGAPTDIVFATAASAGAATEKCRLTSDGKLLVGTSTDTTARLVVKGSAGSGDDGINVISGSTTVGSKAAIFFSPSTSGSFSTGSAIKTERLSPDGSDLQFYTCTVLGNAPTERMRIDNAGNVFIAEGSTVGRLNVAQSGSGAVYFARHTSAASAGGFQIQYSTAFNNTGNPAFYFSDGTLRAEIRSNGGLANFQANNVNLSDINTKTDISPAANTWDCIKEWEIVNYRYKDQPDDADLNLGVIAQQVAESCPEVITVFEEAKEAKPAVLDKDGNEVEPEQEAQPEKLGVKEQQMYWMAIKALQEAMERIETLEAKVAALETA